MCNFPQPLLLISPGPENTNSKGNLKQLQTQVRALDLPIKFTYEKTITGWVGKPKGSLQILYKRGWIDPDKLSDYTEKGKMSEMGVLRKDKSLKILMERQQDFHSELTLLQFHERKLGCTIDQSPKCHPEIAGEEIELIWALAKLWYRRQPINLKRRKQQFQDLVQSSASTEHVVTLSQV